MIKTPLGSQDKVLYSTPPKLSAILTLSSATLPPAQNCQTSQQFPSPLYCDLQEPPQLDAKLSSPKSPFGDLPTAQTPAPAPIPMPDQGVEGHEGVEGDLPELDWDSLANHARSLGLCTVRLTGTAVQMTVM